MKADESEMKDLEDEKQHRDESKLIDKDPEEGVSKLGTMNATTVSQKEGNLNFGHNRYATRKTAAQGMMVVALMLANASQLKSVLQIGSDHKHYTFLVSLIALSIFFQVVAGILLLLVGSRESYTEDHELQQNIRTNRFNNIAVALIFLITIINIFITSFGIDNEQRSD